MWVNEEIAPPLLTSELDGGECLASRPGRFTPGKKPPGTRGIEGWAGPRACVDNAKKRKTCCPYREHLYSYLSICLSIYGSTVFFGPWPLFLFLNPYKVGRTPWMGDQPVARPLLTHRTTQTQNKRTHTSMP
jgi:hypothetical protein